jgi:hypothetical protein
MIWRRPPMQVARETIAHLEAERERLRAEIERLRSMLARDIVEPPPASQVTSSAATRPARA